MTHTILSCNTEKALESLGTLIDDAFFKKNSSELNKAIKQLDELRERRLTNKQKAISHYFSGNAWADLQSFSCDQEEKWHWDKVEIVRELFHFRKAIALMKKCDINRQYKIQTITNLSNTLHRVGRFIESLDLLNQAISLDPTFYLARCNRGLYLLDFGSQLYDDGHRLHIAKNALEEINEALSLPWSEHYQKERNSLLERKLFLEDKFTPKAISILNDEENNIRNDNWDDDKETKYRLWCLRNRLFLNPLNELNNPLGCYDVIGCPNMFADQLEVKPIFQKMFNQIVQEFATARYIYFSGVSSNKFHFSDREVQLVHTFDHSIYGYSIERLKTAFRIAFSIFDKISYFINIYAGLGIKEHSVSFRRVWYRGGNRKKGIWPHLEHCPNWALRGLFWVSKDLYEDKEGFRDAADPTAKIAADIRNHIEHKFLVIDAVGDMRTEEETFSLIIEKSQFETITLQLLKIVRSAILYLSTSINIEETKYKRHFPDDAVPLPQFLLPIDNGFKDPFL